MNTKKIKVLLADDHQMILDGLQYILEEEKDIELVGTALDGKEVINLLKDREVDILVLDLSMPRMDGVETLKFVRHQHTEVQTIILSYSREGKKIKDVLQKGARGYVLKNRGGKDLVNAIRTVSEGERFIPAEITETMLDYLSNPESAAPHDPLHDVRISDREADVLACLMDGMIAKEIGDTLCIEKSTVDSHKKKIMEKTGLRKETMLVLFARDRGIKPWSKRKIK